MLSNWAKNLGTYYPIEAFTAIREGNMPNSAEICDFINLYIFSHIPYFIHTMPIAYQRAIEIFAKRLEVNSNEIYLTGSAKLGFSLTPESEKWLRKYDAEKSDLDFFIVSRSLFNRLSKDLDTWATHAPEKAEESIQRKKTRGFIDVWKIPNKENYQTVSRCMLYAHQACLNINCFSKKKLTNTKKGYTSVRCYMDQAAASKQIRINIDYACKNACALNKTIPKIV